MNIYQCKAVLVEDHNFPKYDHKCNCKYECQEIKTIYIA